MRLIIISLFLLSCAHSAVIRSEPSGAAIFRDGERVGVTPYEFNYRSGRGGFDMRLEKDGYAPVAKRLERRDFDSEYSIGVLIAGGSLLTLGVVSSIVTSTPLPYYATSAAVGAIGTSLYFQKFEEEYTFPLKAAAATAPTAVTAP